MRKLLVAVALCSLLGCKGKKAEPKENLDDIEDDEPEPALSPPKLAAAATHAAVADQLVIVNADGSLLVGAHADGAALASVKGEPVELADLATALAQMPGTAMQLDETKMHDQPKPPPPDDADGGMSPADRARKEAIEAAKIAGILGSDQLVACETVDELYAGPHPAGLRATTFSGIAWCDPGIVLVIADQSAPAARVVDVLATLPRAELGVTTDGKDLVALGALFSFEAGNTPPAARTELAFAVSPGAKLTEVATEARKQHQTVRVTLDNTATAGDLATALAPAIPGETFELGFGTPIDVTPPSETPTVRPGEPTGSGDLDRATLRRVIKRNLARIAACYEKELIAKPALAGVATAQFLIEPSGTVGKVTVKGVDDAVDGCIAEVIEGLVFPKPKGGGPVNVTSYPFELAPR